jgi:hypothetical protein
MPTVKAGIYEMRGKDMADIYQDVTAIIPNTTMRLRVIDGNPRSYWITPNEGYVLHDASYDAVREEPTVDPETGEETINYIPVLGYRPTTASCSARYEFTPVEMQDDEGNTHTAYGSRQFFTRPIEDVPADQIFGGGNTESETM